MTTPTNKPRPVRRWLDRLVRKTVVAWIGWRYGGPVYALKPPLGFHPMYSPKPWWWVAFYRVKQALWRVECASFNRWGTEMKAAWLKSVQSPNAGTQRPGSPDGPLVTETRKPGSLK